MLQALIGSSKSCSYTIKLCDNSLVCRTRSWLINFRRKILIRIFGLVLSRKDKQKNIFRKQCEKHLWRSTDGSLVFLSDR